MKEGSGELQHPEPAHESTTTLGSRASRELAKQHRQQQLPRKFKLDEHGVKDLEQSKQFSFFATPKSVGMESPGLGVYFASGLVLIVLMLAYACLSLYPLFEYKSGAKYENTYTLYVEGVAFSGSGECEKIWEVSNTVTEMSLGALCPPGDESTSVISCPTRCDYSAATAVEKGALRGVDCSVRNGGTEAQEFIDKGMDHGDWAPDGVCQCCSLDFDRPLPRVEKKELMWIWFAAQIVTWAGIIVLRRLQRITAAQIDEAYITSSDFAVMVTGVGVDVDVADKLKNWARHYGEVAHVAPLLNIGGVMRKCERLDNMRRDLAELEEQLASVRAHGKSGCFCLGRSVFWLYLAKIGALGGQTPAALEKGIAKKKAAIKALEARLGRINPESLHPISKAVVVFNFSRHRDNCLSDHKRIGRKPTLEGRKVRVEPAAEPSDIIWSNTDFYGFPVWVRRIASLLFACLLVLGGGAIQYAIEQWRAQLYDARTTISDSLSESSFPQNEENTTSSALTGFLAGLVVTLTNTVIQLTLRITSRGFDRWHSHTNAQKALIIKLSVAYIINSYIVPIVAQRVSKSGRSATYVPDGLMDSALSTLLINAFVPPTVALIDPVRNFQVMLGFFYARTQDKMNQLMTPPDFLLAERYAAQVKTLALGILWAPALPIAPVICLAGLLYSYAIDRYIALRMCKQPAQLGDDVQIGMNYVLKLIPLVQIITVHQVWFVWETDNRRTTWIVVSLAIWLVFAVLTSFDKLIANVSFDSGASKIACLGYMRKGLVSPYKPLGSFASAPTVQSYVQAVYELPREVVKGVMGLMPHQKADTGGVNVAAPRGAVQKDISEIGGDVVFMTTAEENDRKLLSVNTVTGGVVNRGTPQLNTMATIGRTLGGASQRSLVAVPTAGGSRVRVADGPGDVSRVEEESDPGVTGHTQD
ncbi:unnamed protein product [Pedinophyceae sp. YPF-701]|nr:unnamed protein product [Pedinophyceae sp. YPF-701]